MALIIAHSTNQIYRIKVRTLFEHLFFLRIVHINLRTFKNLQGNSTVTIICQERTATRLAYIFHHTAYTHRTIQFLFQIKYEFSIFQILGLRIFTEQFLLQELQNFEHLLVSISAAIQKFQISKCFLLQRH